MPLEPRLTRAMAVRVPVVDARFARGVAVSRQYRRHYLRDVGCDTSPTGRGRLDRQTPPGPSGLMASRAQERRDNGGFIQ